ncbi:MAG: tape measure protein [Azonexus sp.]|jgi:tape measure domain-containing protein|nr:tape measure protein [Azonexus sp.]
MAGNLELALRIRADLRQAYDSLGQLTSGFDRLDGSVSASRRGLVSISRQLAELRNLAIAGVGVTGVNDLIKLADEYGQMASRIKMATASTEEYQMVQARLLETAQNTYRPLVEAQEMYIRTADALRSLGYNTAQAVDVSDSLSFLMVTNAASSERASSAINAFSKALQTGKVDAEGWQTLLAAVPSIVDSIAEASGKTAEEIRKLGAAGDLSLTDLTEGLRRSVEQNKQAAAEMPTTVADAFTRLRAALQAYLGEANEGAVSTRVLSAAVVTLAENIEVLAGAALAGAGAALLRWVGGLVIAQAAQVRNTIAAQRLAAAELAAAEAAAVEARAMAALTGNMAAATAATERLAAAQARAAAASAGMAGVGRSLLGVLTGPMGLALTVGSLAATWLIFRDNTKAAESALADMNKTAEQAREEFGKLSEAQQATALSAIADQVVETNRQFKNQSGRFAAEIYRDFANVSDAGRGTADFLRAEFNKVYNGLTPNFEAMTKAVQASVDLSAEQRRRYLEMIASAEAYAKKVDDVVGRLDTLAQKSPVVIELEVKADTVAIGKAEEEFNKIARDIANIRDPSAAGRFDRDVAPSTGLRESIPEEKAALDALRAIYIERDRLQQAAKKTGGGSKQDPFGQKQIELAKSLAESQQRLANAQAGVEDSTTKASSALDIWLKTSKEGASLSGQQKAALFEQALAVDAAARAYNDFAEAKKRAEDIKAGMDGVEIELLKLEGNTAEAARREFEEKYAELRAALQKELAGGSLTAQAQIDLIVRLQGITEARRQLDEVSAAIGNINAQNSRDEQSIDAQVSAGLLTEIEGRQRLIDLHRQTATALQAQIPILQQLAAAGGEQGRLAAIQLQELQTQLITLQNTSNELQVALKNGLTSGLNEAITGLANGTMTLREAVTSLVQSVVNGLAQIAAQRLAEGAAQGAMSLLGMGGGEGAGLTDGATALSGSAGELAASGGTLIAAATMLSSSAAALAAAKVTGGTSGAASGFMSGGGLDWGSIFGSMAGAGFASGGPIAGPGTGTSDSILLWGSNGEYMIRAASVRQPGARDFLDHFNAVGMRALSGYAEGGFVMPPGPAQLSMPASGSLPEPAKALSATLNNAVNLHVYDDPERIASAAFKSRQGVENFVVMLSRDPARFRQVLGVS